MLSLIACSIEKARQNNLIGLFVCPFKPGIDWYRSTINLLIIIGVWRFDRILFEQGFGTRAQDEWQRHK